MVTIAELQAFINYELPHSCIVIEHLGDKSARVRKPITQAHLRPGGTVSGPTMMELADIAIYVALLGEIGIVPLAVTTNLNINFLRKPSAECDIIADCRLLKLGKSLAIAEVSVFSNGYSDLVAHAVGTYSIPPAS
ncbi:PaaI family thioesterase [Shewanella algae]|uniref:PaaI family thioesterase n=1 Tax=Shewanella algae TaxID=38313 RepID=UPI001AAC640E|nr:PaaI family thioesterase [Shewanella algae]QTE96617.1 PaaI family thioesterase [Shewanella algae]